MNVRLRVQDVTDLMEKQVRYYYYTIVALLGAYL